jgi:hypothetical protein
VLIGVVVICIVALGLELLAPRLSRKPQGAAHRGFGAATRTSGYAPTPLGRWLPKPFRSSQRAADRSAAAGRKADPEVS